MTDLTHLEQVAGFKLSDIPNASAESACTLGGVFIRQSELVDLFNLLEANPATWNRRLRVSCSAWILYLVSEGKLDVRAEVIEKPRSTPGR